jgi:hypothetical protein
MLSTATSITQMPESILDKTFHARILQDVHGVCSVAGVQPKYLHSSMIGICGEVELDWIRNFRRNEVQGNTGIMLLGVTRSDARCQAMAAALLRNYTDARVIPLNSLLDSPEDGKEAHVLFIPNLFVASSGKAMPSYRVQAIYDLLLWRSTQGKSTAVYVENTQGLVGAYGSPFNDFLSDFTIVTK